jgi:nucleoside phosphorylase
MDEEPQEIVFLQHIMDRLPFPGGEIWSNDRKQAALGLLWADLLTRKTEAVGTTGRGETKTDIKPKAKNIKSSGTPNQAIDALVICPLAKELNPSLYVFDLDPAAREDRNIDGHKVYFTKIPRQHGGDLQVAISVVTKPRNVPSALATAALILRLNPTAIFLSGIGAGVKGKVELGDVVISTLVIDIAGGRAEVDKIRSRDSPCKPPSPMDKYVDYFRPDKKSWRTGVTAILSRIRRTRRFSLPPARALSDQPLEIHGGIVVAGEQLVADGSLPQYLEKDDRIRSCEMEGSGFAQACEGGRKPWLVFRGICDFGDPAKNDEWQATAAVLAAKAVRAFLQSEYRLPTEVEPLF